MEVRDELVADRERPEENIVDRLLNCLTIHWCGSASWALGSEFWNRLSPRESSGSWNDGEECSASWRLGIQRAASWTDAFGAGCDSIMDLERII